MYRGWFNRCSTAGMAGGILIATGLPAGDALAVPAFARQTGQNCVACHAGGQFPELTPYGRIFKLTGYTLGTRGLPLSVMGVATYTKTKNTDTTPGGGTPSADFPKDGTPLFNTGSLFLAGKVTDNIGGFVQVTYNNYAGVSADGTHFAGHTSSDNLDLRYADRFIDASRDLIVGLSLNNNPSVQDVFNSAPAWIYNYVPGSTAQAGNVATPLLSGGLAQNVAGLSAYAYWNKTLYAELGFYRTADKIFSFMSQGNDPMRGQAALRGLNPYFRLALTREWGPHNAMVGLMGMSADQYPDPTLPTGPVDRFRDIGLDAQYQYLLDPHTVTAQLSYLHERHDYSGGSVCASLDQASNSSCSPGDPANLPSLQAATNAADTIKLFRAKVSYVYQAKYGGTLSYFNVSGSTNSLNQTSAVDPALGIQGSGGAGGNATGNPGTTGWTAEVFWTPVQYARVGLQYTLFTKFNGATDNYDGFGRNAKDNNTLFAYVWGAY